MSDIKEKIENMQPKINQLYDEIGKKIIGQKTLIRDLLIALFSKGHVLIEGAPGLAKTLAVDTLSNTLTLDFNRIQFTPDLLPSDLIGNNIYNPAKNEFSVKKGPIFTNFLLADEINRAPSKVQSALLEAMAEKQVSIGDKTYKLEMPFIVLATQNPIEQEGTYNLPEAQLDRFLLKTVVEYPSREEEKEIIKNISNIETVSINKVFNKEDIFEIEDIISNVLVNDNIIDYIESITYYTRNKKSEINKYLSYPVSPRASISLKKTAMTYAVMQGRDFVIPEDIKEMIYPVFRHRLILSYEAMADEIKSDDIIEAILNNVLIK